MIEMGTYPSILEDEAPFDDPDAGIEFDDPATNVISKEWHLRKASKAMRLELFGEDRYPTIEEDEAFATTIQDGLCAESELSHYLSTRKRPREATVVAYQERIDAGIQAQHTLVTINIPFALQSARASMNIFPKSMSQKDIDRTCSSISTYGDIRALRSPYASLADREQNAIIGLVRAARNFNPQGQDGGRKAQFVGFAKFHINQCMQRGITDDETPGIIVPNQIEERVRLARRETGETDIDNPAEYDRLMHISAMMEAVPIDSENLTSYDTTELSSAWDEPVAHTVPDVATNLDDATAAELAAETHLRTEIKDALDTLSEREAGIIVLRFGLTGPPKTLDEIGNIYGITRERVRQIESKAITRLRHPGRSESLKGYLDNDTSDIIPGQSIPSTASGIANISTTQHKGHQNPSTMVTSPYFEMDATLEAEDDWEAPVRFTPEQVDALKERAYDRFIEAVCELDALDFVPYGHEMYPERAIGKVEAAGGIYLDASHIERFWKEIGPELYRDMSGRLGQEKIGLFVSGLLQDLLRQDETVTFEIPDDISGKIHYFASELSYGRVIVNGDLGDFAGSGNAGVSELFVDGSVGEYAMAGAKGFALAKITGDADRHFALNATTEGALTVHGVIAQLDLSPEFRGEILAGKVKRTTLGGVAINDIIQLRAPRD